MANKQPTAAPKLKAKRSFKAPPPVRQTKASLMRLVRANPLVIYQNEGTRDCSIDEIKNKLPAAIIQDPTGTFTKLNREHRQYERECRQSFSFGAVLKRDVPPVKQDVFRVPTALNRPKQPAKEKLPPKVVRKRSLSADCFVRPGDENFGLSIEGQICQTTVTQSMVNLNLSPINSSKVVFKTPNKMRKMNISTPHSERRISRGLPSLLELQTRLNKWLKRRNKPSTMFKCLGSLKDETLKFPSVIVTNVDNKENMQDTVIENKVDTEELIEEALRDLLSLIRQGYEPDQCEAWLSKLRQKYTNIEDKSIYWECRAALEQIGENLSTALECYKTAIIKGAEITNIGDSLDNLLNKFCILNMDDNIPTTEVSRHKENKVKEVCEVFKSSIVQFALLERKIKNQEKNIIKVATPVRRSSRLSHIRTPGLKLCSSFRELEDITSEELNFKNNTHLSVRYN